MLNAKYLVQEPRDGSGIGPMLLLLSVSHLQTLCFLPPVLGHCLLRDLVPGNIPSARGHRKGPIETEASNYFGNFSAQYIDSGPALFYW